MPAVIASLAAACDTCSTEAITLVKRLTLRLCCHIVVR
jgi:hypothetical protein